MIRIDLDPEFSSRLSASVAELAAEKTLLLRGAADADLTVVLTGDEQVQALNREFLKRDRPTDVLAFPADQVDLDTGRKYLGDVIISVATAQKQASAGGHLLESEISLLVVHGILHLLGFDHENAQDKIAMWAAQEMVLKQLGIPADILHE